MVFNMTSECLANLVGLPKGDTLNVNDVYLKFTNSSQKKIIDLFTKDGGKVNAKNQELAVDMVLKRVDYEKIKNCKNFYAKIVTLVECNGIQCGVEFEFGNFHISYYKSKVSFNGDSVTIQNVEMLLIPSGNYTYKYLEDE